MTEYWTVIEHGYRDQSASRDCDIQQVRALELQYNSVVLKLHGKVFGLHGVEPTMKLYTYHHPLEKSQ